MSTWQARSEVFFAIGLLHLFCGERAPSIASSQSLELIAVAHTAAAFLMAAFVFGHVYLKTTGHTLFAHIKAMVTGWEEVEKH